MSTRDEREAYLFGTLDILLTVEHSEESYREFFPGHAIRDNRNLVDEFYTVPENVEISVPAALHLLWWKANPQYGPRFDDLLKAQRILVSKP